MYAEDLFDQLLEKGHRFLKPSGGQYEVLDREAGVVKIHHALRECRTKTVGTGKVSLAELSESFDFSGGESFQAPQKKQKTGKASKKKSSLVPPKDKLFDDVARQALSTILSTQELADAMERNWGSEIDKKRELFEDKVRVLFSRYSPFSISPTHRVRSFLLNCTDAGALQSSCSKWSVCSSIL